MHIKLCIEAYCPVMKIDGCLDADTLNYAGLSVCSCTMFAIVID